MLKEDGRTCRAQFKSIVEGLLIGIGRKFGDGPITLARSQATVYMERTTMSNMTYITELGGLLVSFSHDPIWRMGGWGAKRHQSSNLAQMHL